MKKSSEQAAMFAALAGGLLLYAECNAQMDDSRPPLPPGGIEAFIEAPDRRPADLRVVAYWRTGAIDKALDLAARSMLAGDIRMAKRVIDSLAGFRSARSLLDFG
ncbi:MAG: hypothetical protein GY862_29695 [Gammaproteobacteria bacterium]|nr:hypothetical protein [Gammaproteobacteria bacterium]